MGREPREVGMLSACSLVESDDENLNASKKVEHPAFFASSQVGGPGWNAWTAGSILGMENDQDETPFA